MTTVDGAVQAWVLAHQAPMAHTVFLWISRVGGVVGMRVLALLGAAYLWYRARPRLAAGMILVLVVANALFEIAKPLYARPRPPGLGGRVDSSYSFPSGHATMSAAVCGALAYVLWREGLIGPASAVALAVLVPLVVGVSRVYLNVHWATDVIGGWGAGLLVAGLAVAFYDYRRRHRETSPVPAR
jgi:membrane-associated phospholipid phosphatase